MKCPTVRVTEGVLDLDKDPAETVNLRFDRDAEFVDAKAAITAADGAAV